PRKKEEPLRHQHGRGHVQREAGDRDRVRREPRLDQALAHVVAQFRRGRGPAVLLRARTAPDGPPAARALRGHGLQTVASRPRGAHDQAPEANCDSTRRDTIAAVPATAAPASASISQWLPVTITTNV